jgi:hypothetical protein
MTRTNRVGRRSQHNDLGMKRRAVKSDLTKFLPREGLANKDQRQAFESHKRKLIAIDVRNLHAQTVCYSSCYLRTKLFG